MSMEHPKSVQDYFARIGAEVKNFHRAMVVTYQGPYYKEQATIRLKKDSKTGDITVTSSKKQYAPTDEELKQMLEELKDVKFPTSVKARTTEDLVGPIGKIYELIDQEDGSIIMVQERRELPDGSKRYLPWCMFNDGKWECLECDGDLPFWKPQKTNKTKIMIHEGAKVAEYITRMIEDPEWDHPWKEYLSQFEHWGIIGGALAGHRAAYDELVRRAPSEVVYSCDNDRPGINAVQVFSKNWKRPLKMLVYGEHFPPSWDLADPMPKHLFSRSGRYNGKPIQSFLLPATWATETVPPQTKAGRPSFKITEAFATEWMHCIQPEIFVHQDFPSRIMSASEFDSSVRPFSNSESTSRIMKSDLESQVEALKYDPSIKPGRYAASTEGRFVNTYTPTDIVPEAGDEGPWHEFMRNFIPDEHDRHEMMRFCATLIAHPEVRMNYGILMVSETQGIGKGTLAEKIIAPLVGDANVSYPCESIIVESNYNYWLAHKRLAVIHEIYAGNSSKAYNKLKSIVTDKQITVQKKYQPEYTIDCWIHIIACSNSKRALKIDQADRRWFIPKITENKQPAEYWERLNRWLIEEGGLKIILNWAIEFTKDPENIVRAGVEAPISTTKGEIIHEGYSPGQMLVENILTIINEKIKANQLPDTTFVLDVDLVNFVKNQLHEGRQVDKLEKPATLRAVAKRLGWYVGETQAQVSGWGLARRGARVLSLNPDIALKSPSDIGGSKVSESERLKPFDLQSLVEF